MASVLKVLIVMFVMVAIVLMMMFSLTSDVVKCPPNADFTFNNFQFEKTLVTEWDLVCDQDYKVPCGQGARNWWYWSYWQ